MAKIILWIAQTGFVASGILTPEQVQELSSIADGFLSLVIIFAILGLAVVLPIIMRDIHMKLQASKNQTNWALLAKIADHAVQSAEQTIIKGDNVTKYDYAAKLLSQIAISHNVTGVTPDICRLLIESAVYGLREDQKYFSPLDAKTTAS